MKKYLLLLLVVLMYEGFGLLPESLTVLIPGYFRMKDIIFPVFVLLCCFKFASLTVVFRRNTQASLIVLSFCLLLVLGIVMARAHFGQSIFTGFLKLRDNFNIILVFILFLLIDNEKDLSFVVRGLSLIVCVVGVLSVIQYFIPNVHIFSGKDIEGIYSGTKLLRLGSYRLYFPAASLAVLLFCYTAGEIIIIDNPKFFYLKCTFLLFLFTLFFMQQTRARLLTLSVVSLIAIFMGKKVRYKIVATALVCLLVMIQLLFFSISGHGIISLKNSRIYKLTQTVFSVFDKKQEASIRDRFIQAEMYTSYFQKYPICGAGTLAFGSPLSKKYGLYNTSDLGYLKLLCEYGLVGMTWLVWLFIYVFRKSRVNLGDMNSLKDLPDIYMGIMYGTRFFYLYVLVSMLTLPHFSRGHTITYMGISIALLDITVHFLGQGCGSCNVPSRAK